MPSRKRFLTGLSAAGTSVALASSATAEAATASPTPAPRPKISDAARAQARAMRRFDPKLTGEEIETIARGIDESVRSASALSPPSAPLRNADEPVTHFVLAAPSARA